MSSPFSLIGLYSRVVIERRSQSGTRRTRNTSLRSTCCTPRWGNRPVIILSLSTTAKSFERLQPDQTFVLGCVFELADTEFYREGNFTPGR